MANRFLPLALTISVVATGCAQALLAGPSAKTGAAPAQVASARHAPSGFGQVTVDVRGLLQAPGFHTASMKGVSVGKGVLIVRDSSNDSIVTDVSGNPAAYYFTVPSAGNATITIPDLPSTAATR